MTADALYVGALDISLIRHCVSREDAAGLAFLYLGKQRADQLKQSAEIPHVSRELLEFMSAR